MSKQESVLSYLLSKAGKTFKDLANYIGVEESTPYRWSRGTRIPSGYAWENLKEFLLTECRYPADCLKVLGSLDALRYYLDQNIDRDNEIIIKLRGEIDGNKTMNTLQQYLDTLRDENGNEVQLPKRNLKEALENPDTILPPLEYSQVGVGLGPNGINLHGGGSGCVAIKGITVPRKITSLIEERFREFLNHPQHHQQFIELVDCYGRYFNMTQQNW